MSNLDKAMDWVRGKDSSFSDLDKVRNWNKQGEFK